MQKGGNLFSVAMGNPWIQLSTDAAGNVVTWHFEVKTGFSAPQPDWPDQFVYAILYETEGKFYSYTDLGRNISRDNDEQSFYGIGDDPGVWTFTDALPDLAFTTVTPEPPGASLMALGLLLVGVSCRCPRSRSSRR